MIFLDIETMPQASKIGCMPAPEIALGNLKDPEKIEAKKAEAQKKQIEKMALNPLYGRICAFCSIRNGDQSEHKYCIAADDDDDERILLQKLFEAISFYTVVTFNGKNFDLPFIYHRAALLNVNPAQYGAPTLKQLSDRRNPAQLDLMEVWSGYGQFEKLENLAKAFFDDGKQDIDFHKFPELIKTTEGREKILDYCMQDVKLTQNIYYRFENILF